MNADVSTMLVYTGTSMNPTLCEPDLLEIRPYRDRPIHPGDVILFQAPARSLPIVHRVQAVTPKGIRTRGDSSRRTDDWWLTPGQIIGQVTTVHRGLRRRTVWNGRIGWAWSEWLRIILPVRSATIRILRAPYRALSDHRVFSRRLPSRWRPRQVVFRIAGRPVRRMIWGGYVIGQYDAERGVWRIRRPFRLFIDPRDMEVQP